MFQRLGQGFPVRLAQTSSGHDAGTATAGSLLNTFRLPTQQHLPSIPNYDPDELERQRGNRYYRQAPGRPDDADPLHDDANASADSTLRLVTERAAEAPWPIDLRAIDARQGGQVSIPENGCGVFEYCAATGPVDRPEQCTVHYAYEEATCHEYYSHDIECETVTQTGGGGLCNDAYLYVRLIREEDGTYTLVGLDTGPGHDHHRNCWDGPSTPFECATPYSVDCGDSGTCVVYEYDQACVDAYNAAHYVGDWHILARLPASTDPPEIQVNTAGGGCVPESATLNLPAYTRSTFPGLNPYDAHPFDPTYPSGADPSVGLCGDRGAQVNTYVFVSSGRSCRTVPHFHDTCASYKQAPWFEANSQCLSPAPGLTNDCDDLLRTYGRYTETANTCDPWIGMGCTELDEPCRTEDCTTRTRRYRCREEGCVRYQTTVLCSTCIPDPPNPPKCITTDTPANTEFGLATAMLEGQVTAEQNRENDGVEIYAFPGFAQACASNPLINCCTQGSAQETADNIRTGIQAMQMAMNAYKAYQTFSTAYTATTTLVEVYGYAMVEAAQIVATEMMSSYVASMFAFSWAGVMMVVVMAVALLMQMLMTCDEASTETAIKTEMGLCVEAGEYCSQKILFACWGKKHAACCFVSRLARIIQEQGRAQLGIGWGDPKAPDCRGLTVDELQAINWERLDFSEYIAELQTRITVPTVESVTQRGAHLMGSTDFLGQAHATLDRYAGLEARVTHDLTVPGTDPPASTPATARMTLGITGQGTITVSPGDHSCGRGTCPIQLPANQAFSATATPAEGWGFSGWSGACSGSGACRFTLTREHWLNATFVQTNLPFPVRVVGPGT
ncbi:MAG: conjugal transfer protein TraN, partial [Candidatus Methylomirabilota bacterium]